MPEPPPISNEMLGQMTAEQLSRAGVALRLKIEAPPGSGKMYDLLMCPTKDLKRFQGRAEIVATYTEVDGVCKAHARTKDDGINMDSLVGLVRFRERAAADGLTLFATEVVAATEALSP